MSAIAEHGEVGNSVPKQYREEARLSTWAQCLMGVTNSAPPSGDCVNCSMGVVVLLCASVRRRFLPHLQHMLQMQQGDNMHIHMD
eukprot:gene12946-5985_t